MANTVIGFFDDAIEAQRAIEELQQNGISQSNIEFSSREDGDAHNMSSDADAMETNDRDKHGNAVTRFFSSLFGDDSDDARKYSRVGESTNYIVTVHARSSEEAEEVADILDDCGAIDVDERAASFGTNRYEDTTTSSMAAGTMNMDGSSDRTSDMTGSDSPADRSSDSINRIEEDLHVGKRQVETGRVRLRSRIIETPVEEHIRLRQERVDIQRTPVDRRVSAEDAENFREQEIELTERAEVPVVNKEARVVEEIRVNKDVDTRDEVIRDTVKKTDIDIDEDRTSSGNTTGRSSLSDL